MVHLPGCRNHVVEGAVCRNWQSSPLIVQPDGKVRAYGRASSHGDALDDKGNLIAWSQANAIRGVLADRALAAEFSKVDDDWVTIEAKKATRAVIAAAAKAGGAEKKADLGTDLHSWTERLDLGLSLDGMPPEFELDLMAYEHATRDMTHLVIEEFCVLDSHRIAGTPDRITEYEGENYVFDLKTGSVAFPNKMSVQLAVYSRSELYAQAEDGTAVRTPLPPVNQERAIILHLPAGQGQATPYWIDIAKGYRAIQEYVPIVKAWRADKTLLTPISA